MLLLIAVLAFLSAAFMLYRYVRRQPDTQFFFQNTISNDPPQNARPLFAPSEQELAREADKAAAQLIARREYNARASARAAVDAALHDWRAGHTGKGAAELLRITAESGLDGDFSRSAAEIVEVFHTSGIDSLTSDDVAALLDSHIQLLSSKDRSSGAIFWLKQEVARLRTEKQ